MGGVQLLYLTELCTPAVNTCFSLHAICFLSPCCQDTLLTGGVYFFVSICNHIVRFFFFLLPACSLLSDSIFQLLFYCFSFSIPCLLSLYVFQITSLALCFICTCFILPCTDPLSSSDIIRGYGERYWFGMVIIVRELAKPDSPTER